MRRCVDCDIVLLPYEEIRCNECFELNFETYHNERYRFSQGEAAEEAAWDMSYLQEPSEESEP